MDAPNFLESSYHRDYKSVSQSMVSSAKQPEIRLMGGGKLTAVTTIAAIRRVPLSHPEKIRPANLL